MHHYSCIFLKIPGAFFDSLICNIKNIPYDVILVLFDVVGFYSNISYSDVLSHSSSLLDMCHDKTVSSSMLLKLMEIKRDESLQWISFIIKNLEQLLVPKLDH